MTLMFDVPEMNQNQYNVGFGSVPIRITNIRSSSGTYGAARFYLSSSGQGKFSDYMYTASDGRIYMSYNGSIGTNGSWNTKECIYTPTSSGTHVITIVGVPYGSDNVARTSEGSTVSKSVSISAMYCDYARAMFTSSAVDGYAPLTVAFNCITPDQNISISWDFGDGTTSTQRSPTHTYQSAGQYRPKLTVRGWKNASCTGTAPTDTVSDRIISVFAANVPQCVTGIRCNNGAGFYEECVNGRYVLTTTPCAQTIAATDAAQTAYEQIIASTAASGGTGSTSPAVAAAAAASAAASGNTVPIYQPSQSNTTAGGGMAGAPSGGLFSSTSLLFNPITLAAAGLGVAGIAIYFWKFRKPRDEL